MIQAKSTVPGQDQPASCETGVEALRQNLALSISFLTADADTVSKTPFTYIAFGSPEAPVAPNDAESPRGIAIAIGSITLIPHDAVAIDPHPLGVYI